MSRPRRKERRRSREAEWRQAVKAHGRGEAPIQSERFNAAEDATTSDQTAGGEPTVLYLSEMVITDEPLKDKGRPLPPALKKQWEDLFDLVRERPGDAVPVLEKLIEEYPQVPELYNFLATACSHAGQTDKAERIVRLNYSRNPDYLFAKLNYAEYCLHENRLEEIPAIFENKLDLRMLYPHRRRFHITEFTGFAYVIGTYLWRIGEHHSAKCYLNAMKEMAPDHPGTKRMQWEMADTMLSKTMSRLMSMMRGRRSPRGETPGPRTT